MLGGFNPQLKFDISCEVVVAEASITHIDAGNIRFRIYRLRLEVYTTIMNAGHLDKSFAAGDGIATYCLRHNTVWRFFY